MLIVCHVIGACDKTAKVFDCRTPDNYQTWDLSGEPEKMLWHPIQPFQFIVGTNTGIIQCFDCRQGQLWSIEAHEKEITGLSISSICPGLVVTTSAEGDLKVWDMLEDRQPEFVYQRDLKMGMVHCLDINPNCPFLIASGGDNKSHNLSVLDLLSEDTGKIRDCCYYFSILMMSFFLVKHRFGSRNLNLDNNQSN